MDILDAAHKKCPKLPALEVKRAGKCMSWTYEEFHRDALRLAKGLMALNGVVHFADPSALQDSIVEFLKCVKPTRFFAVPRIWEKIEGKIKAFSPRTEA